MVFANNFVIAANLFTGSELLYSRLVIGVHAIIGILGIFSPIPTLEVFRMLMTAVAFAMICNFNNYIVFAALVCYASFQRNGILLGRSLVSLAIAQILEILLILAYNRLQIENQKWTGAGPDEYRHANFF
ncbi:hypothetical protein L5515_005283 [Caenorhabditis briggsae]|uniref:Uncharacterized protein n=1 Tax=Caenorhabditis briggsae TaxID=6238 RepID=A0AAE9EJV2_CAEBR|nr:hypothetical protein L5515_005283 [Caenorhabditis briggsae]